MVLVRPRGGRSTTLAANGVMGGWSSWSIFCGLTAVALIFGDAPAGVDGLNLFKDEDEVEQMDQARNAAAFSEIGIQEDLNMRDKKARKLEAAVKGRAAKSQQEASRASAAESRLRERVVQREALQRQQSAEERQAPAAASVTTPQSPAADKIAAELHRELLELRRRGDDASGAVLKDNGEVRNRSSSSFAAQKEGPMEEIKPVLEAVSFTELQREQDQMRVETQHLAAAVEKGALDEKQVRAESAEMVRLQKLAEQIEMQRLRQLEGQVKERRAAEAAAEERLQRLADRVQTHLEDVRREQSRQAQVETELQAELTAATQEAATATAAAPAEPVRDEPLAPRKQAKPEPAEEREAWETVANSWPNYARTPQQLEAAAGVASDDAQGRQASSQQTQIANFFQTDAESTADVMERMEELRDRDEVHRRQYNLLVGVLPEMCGSSLLCTTLAGLIVGMLGGFVVFLACGYTYVLLKVKSGHETESSRFIRAALERLDDPKWAASGGEKTGPFRALTSATPKRAAAAVGKALAFPFRAPPTGPPTGPATAASGVPAGTEASSPGSPLGPGPLPGPEAEAWREARALLAQGEAMSLAAAAVADHHPKAADRWKTGAAANSGG
eukprot:TRINITY_DN40744_c0_g1_i1.p1 TRINITY_DN40744_c0_g1~~TRINITY_DN40744_c0_g1_i1.p1  ORF type:complete len:618 (+),score=185.91 TRINITY_DN40744_c0_g1_i1:103-1956(+)